MKIKKSIVVILIFFTIIISACSVEKEDIGIGKDININNGKVLVNIDDRSEISDIGKKYMEVSFTDTNAIFMLQSIKNSKEWKQLPLNSDISLLVYGNKKHKRKVLIENNEKSYEFPYIKNGYYFFKNEDTNKNIIDSNNFTIAVYSIDKRILYYFKANE